MLHRQLRWAFVPAALFSLAFAASAQGRTELLVYTALEADQVQAYKAAFEKDNPSIELKFVRDSTAFSEQAGDLGKVECHESEAKTQGITPAA